MNVRILVQDIDNVYPWRYVIMIKRHNLHHGNIKKIILISILVLVPLCGWLIVQIVRIVSYEMLSAQEAAEAFLDDLASNRMKSAYARTSATLQTKYGFEEWSQRVELCPILKTHTSRSVRGVRLTYQPDGLVASVQLVVNDPTISLSCTVILRKEEQEWKVEHLTVP
jgi:hypothetical protein